MFSRSVSLLWCASSLLSTTARSSSLVSSFAIAHEARARFSTATSTSMSATTTATTPDSMKGQTMVSVSDAMALHSSSSANVKFVDGSWFLMGRNGRQEFVDGPRIKGANYFDINDISSKESNLPHMMPPKELFGAAMDAMGISNDDHIIVYGSQDCMFVHRAWFQIRNMGHGKDYCHLLDGSFADWKDQGGPIEQGAPSQPLISANDLTVDQPTNYQAKDPQNIVDMEEMKGLIARGEDDADAIIIDARSSDRFFGKVEEPRPGMRLGHMPGAKNVFFKDLLNPDNVLQFKPKEELERIIKEGGVDLATNKRIIVSCGSGATACALIAALEICGRPSEGCYVYDGSWSEWGSVPDTPIVKEADK